MIVVRVSDQGGAHGLDVVLEVAAGDSTDGHDPVPFALAAVNPHKAVVIVHILQHQGGDLSPPDACRVEELEDRSVSVPQDGRGIRGMEELFHLRLSEDGAGEPLGGLGIGDVSGRVTHEVVMFTEEPEEGFNGLEVVVLGGDTVGLPPVVDLLIKMGLVVPDDILGDPGYLRNPYLREIGKEAPQREEVARDGARGVIEDGQVPLVSLC